MKTSNFRSGNSLVIKDHGVSSLVDNVISSNRLTKVGNALTGTYVDEASGKTLPIFPPELHNAMLAAEARNLKAKGICLPDGTPVDPAKPDSISKLRSLAIAHMEQKGQVNTGPKKRDIAASFKAIVAEALEDTDVSGMTAYEGWSFKVNYKGGVLEVEKVEKHRDKTS